MSKTKVILCGPPVSAVGGGPTHIRNMLASPLQERYCLIHFETGSRGIESPATDEGVLTKFFRLFSSPFALAWRILWSRPTIVHLNSALDNRAFWRDSVYLIICKLLGRKVVFQLHGGLLSALCSTKLSKLLVRRLLSIPNAVVVLARVEKRDFNQLGIVKHLVVIPNGVDVNKYRGSEPRIHSGRIQHLAYMGRLMREKGIFEAIEAVEILRKEPQFSNIELKIAGSGPARAEIERYICEHALDRHVKLVGSLFGADKIHFLREADLFVFSSYHQEGLPYSILESLAAGTPVVASNVAGIPDVLSDGIHGILIKPGNADEIVRAVRTLVCSHDLRAMSLDCQDWASRELGLERLATDFEKLYESIQV